MVWLIDMFVDERDFSKKLGCNQFFFVYTSSLHLRRLTRSKIYVDCLIAQFVQIDLLIFEYNKQYFVRRIR